MRPFIPRLRRAASLRSAAGALFFALAGAVSACEGNFNPEAGADPRDGSSPGIEVDMLLFVPDSRLPFDAEPPDAATTSLDGGVTDADPDGSADAASDGSLDGGVDGGADGALDGGGDGALDGGGERDAM